MPFRFVNPKVCLQSCLERVACVMGIEGYLFVVSVQSRMQLFAVSAPPTSYYLMTWLAPTLALYLYWLTGIALQ